MKTTLQEKLDKAVAFLKSLNIEEKDVMFWNDAETMARMELTEGSYAIYLPDVAHKPGIAIGSPVKVKKCVGKVRV